MHLIEYILQCEKIVIGTDSSYLSYISTIKLVKKLETYLGKDNYIELTENISDFIKNNNTYGKYLISNNDYYLPIKEIKNINIRNKKYILVSPKYTNVLTGLNAVPSILMYESNLVLSVDKGILKSMKDRNISQELEKGIDLSEYFLQERKDKIIKIREKWKM
jgi:hypothetical protein